MLQAFVTEAVKPCLNHVVTYGAGHFYISQSDKGGLVFGGGTDGFNSYAQRGGMAAAEEVFTAGATLMPALARLHVLRQWGGVMDMSMDGNPFISTTPVDNLYPQWRLVLWRLQGRACGRLVHRASGRDRGTASDDRAFSPVALQGRRDDRRARRRPLSVAALKIC